MSIVSSLSSIMFPGVADMVSLSSQLIEISRNEQQRLYLEKKEIFEKLENSSGEETFRYMNLISFLNYGDFVSNSRLAAQQSFKLCFFAAVAGFLLISVSIGFGIYFQFAKIDGMTASYLGTTIGLITEAVSAIFFALYSKSVEQGNRVHNRLLASQSSYAALLAVSLIGDAQLRDKQILEITNKMALRLGELDRLPQG